MLLCPIVFPLILNATFPSGIYLLSDVLNVAFNTILSPGFAVILLNSTLL